MGANQSASRPCRGNHAIPVRPRTPLRFGSVPTALPVNPADYSTQPFKLPYADNSYAKSITSVLSQESYLDSPTFSTSANPIPESLSSHSASSSSESSHSAAHGPRYIVTSINYPLGISTSEEFEIHFASRKHFLPPTGVDFEAENWVPTQEIHSQHPIVHQRQHILEDQRKQQFQQQCVHQCNDASFAHYDLPQQSTTAEPQRPLPPTNVAYYGSGSEYMPWHANESLSAGIQHNYTSAMNSGSYGQNWHVHSAGQSAYM